MEQITRSPEEMYETAKTFVKDITLAEKGATVVGLQGELGSGKTTFVKGVAKALGLEKTVTSPTFVIEKIYKISHPKFQRLIHVDAYRLDNGDELRKLGWRDISSDPENLILVEWPENVSGTIPRDAIKINFEHVSENERKISIQKK